MTECSPLSLSTIVVFICAFRLVSVRLLAGLLQRFGEPRLGVCMLMRLPHDSVVWIFSELEMCCSDSAAAMGGNGFDVSTEK